METTDPIIQLVKDNVEIKVKLDRVITDVKDLGNTALKDIESLKTTKVDKEFLNDELKPIIKAEAENLADIKNLYRYLWIGFGMLIALQFYFQFLKK